MTLERAALPDEFQKGRTMSNLDIGLYSVCRAAMCGNPGMAALRDELIRLYCELGKPVPPALGICHDPISEWTHYGPEKVEYRDEGGEQA